MSPPPPIKGPEPEYEEKTTLEELAKKPTGEWQVPPVLVRGMKQLISRASAAESKQAAAEKKLEVAEKKLKARNTWRLVYGLCGMLGVGGGGVGTWNAHGRSGVLEHRVGALEETSKDLAKKLDKARLKLARCRCPQDPEIEE